jgi:hypothetical protein
MWLKTQTVQQKEKMHFWSNCSKTKKLVFRKTVCFSQFWIVTQNKNSGVTQIRPDENTKKYDLRMVRYFIKKA